MFGRRRLSGRMIQLIGRIYMAGQRNRYGYQEYRGRSRGRTVLIFIIALLAVLLVAGVAFMYVMGEYIEYTPTGIQINWPWLSDAPSAPPEVTDPVVIESDPVEVIVETPAPPTPTPVPEPSYEAIGAVTVTAAQLRDGSATQAVAAGGGNALVVEMKAGTGRLGWHSQSALSDSLWSNTDDDRAAQAVRELAQAGELYLVARIQCFKDPLLANARIGTLMTKGGNVWYDRVGVCWSSPANQQAADYLSQLCLELAEMGFDEILLDSAGYPYDGQVSVLATSDNHPEDLSVPVAAFWQRLSGELAEEGVCLSVYAGEKLLPGETVYSGMTAAVLAQNAGRIWLDKAVDVQHYREILAAAGLDDASLRIVAPAGLAGEGCWYSE